MNPEEHLEQEQEQDEGELAGLEGEALAAHTREPWQRQLVELLRFMSDDPDVSLEQAAHALNMDVGEILRSAEGIDHEEGTHGLLTRGEKSMSRNWDTSMFAASPEEANEPYYANKGHRRLHKPDVFETPSVIASIITEDPDVFNE